MSAEPNQSFDVVIVGAGIVGCWAAMELGQSGLNVLLLEAGGEAGRDPEMTDSDRRKRARDFQPVQSRHSAFWTTNPHWFVSDQEHPYSTPSGKPFTWIRGRQLGGRSLTWSGITLRLSDLDFKAAQRDGYGADWPLSYNDLAPYYDRAEKLLRVHGSRDALSQLPDGNFLKSCPMTSSERSMSALLKKDKRGCRLIMSRGIVNRPTRVPGSGTWSSLSCQALSLPRAVRTKRVAIRTGAIVSELLTDSASPRAKGVAYVDAVSGRTQEVRAKVVLLCASTIESARLLLNSKSSRHPDGFANSSGLVGRNLMDHFFLAAEGFVDRGLKELLPLQGPQSIYIPRFQNIGRSRLPFLRGYGVWGGIGRASGREAKSGRLPVLLVAAGETLARPENRVTLSRDQKDRWGIPVPRISFSYAENEFRMEKHMRDFLQELSLLGNLNLKIAGSLAKPGLFSHEMGTARMGTSAQKSVVNSFGQAWDADNVFVVDGSCWPSAACQNPTLTMIAMAARSCDHIAQAFRDRIFE